MMEEIIARARRDADAAEVFYVSSEEMPVQFEANRLKSIQSKQSTSVSLRLIKDGRIGYAATNQVQDVEHLVAMALETAHFGQVARFKFPGPEAYPEVATYNEATAAVTLATMVDLGQEMIERVRSRYDEVSCEAQVDRTLLRVQGLNSNGGQADYRLSSFSLALEGTRVRDTDMLFVGDGITSCQPLLDVSEVTDKVLRQLELAEKQAMTGRRPLPVIFTPSGIASALVSPLMAAFNGKLVLEGASPLAGQIGAKLFDEKISLSDDPLQEYRPHSRPCDDECVSSRRTPLINRGTVEAFLYDLQTAALAGTVSTGSGNRGRGGLPAPAPGAFVIEPGDVSLEEMIADMRQGIVIEQMMGADQTNILGGDFSGNVLLGYKVEVGEIVGRVKNVMASGNVYDLLRNVTAVGSDTRWVGGFLKTPSLYFPKLSVAAV